MDQELSRWFTFNVGTHEWDYAKTEDHIFAAYRPDGGKRIGDMTREELIQVIAVGYHERDELAVALRQLADAVDLTNIRDAVSLAKDIANAADMDKRMGEIMPAKAGKQVNGHE